MTDHPLSAIGWAPFFERQLDANAAARSTVVRVSAHHGTQVLVAGTDGEFRIPVQNAIAAGEIAVGDWLVLDASSRRATQRLERSTVLHRKHPGETPTPQIIASNIDTVFIVTSCNEDFSLARIERYLALAVPEGITPVVVVTKADLDPDGDAAALRRRIEHLHAGLEVVSVDARAAEAAATLARWCGPGRTVALVGSSGVGKSTLANTLGADDLVTGAIRADDGKGRHTTTVRSLHRLTAGGVLIDNPGVREVQLPGAEDGVADVFKDVVELMGECRFRNCRHEGEPGCAIRAAIAAGDLDARRFDSYRRLEAEQARQTVRLEARRERERARSKQVRAAVDAKRRRRGGRGES